MAEVIRMPRLSDTMEEGVIIGWMKKVGDKVEPGTVLAEVETDKATMELESFHDGYLLYIGVESGPVPVDGVIAVIGKKDEDYKAALSQPGDSTSADQKTSSEEESAPTKKESSESKKAAATEAAEQPGDTSGQETGRVKASPLARSIARETGVDLSSLQGSGDQGRIIKKDIEAALDKKTSAQPAARPASQSTFSAEDSFEEVAVSQMRKTIARRLGESKFSAPHFYLTVELDMDLAVEARTRINEISGIKVSFNDLVVKAVAASLRQHPAVNSSWLGDKIRYNKHIHIGVAVAVDEGLLVPVLRNADFKSLSQINTEVKELAQKAKDKKLQPAEMQGNTFTISNLGMLDIEEFTAIINPPDACILAVGAIYKKPVVKNDQIVIGHRMKVTLSCDHRVVDGATGAQFLKTLRSLLEDPIRMLV